MWDLLGYAAGHHGNCTVRKTPSARLWRRKRRKDCRKISFALSSLENSHRTCSACLFNQITPLAYFLYSYVCKKEDLLVPQIRQKKTSPSAWHIPSASQRASQRRRLHCMNRTSASRTRLRPGMALRGAGDGAPWFFPGRLAKKRVLTCCISTLFFAGMNFLILRLKRAGDSAPF